jgi:phosphatidylglycerol:prolipoprotein diacylglycerol transferase
VLSHLDSYAGRPLDAFKLWEGGLTLYGGLLSAFAITCVLARRWNLSLGQVFDTFTPSVLLGEGITRIGCFLNGCCFGKECQLPWGVVFPASSHPGSLFPDVPLHPTQLYLSLAGFGTFAVIWAVRKRITVPGRLFFLFLLIECTTRFVIDFFRYYRPSGESVVLLGVALSLTQVLCLVLAGVALFGILRRPRQRAAAA